MQSAKKVTLIPARSENIHQIGGGNEQEISGTITSEISPKPDKIKSKIYEKIHKFIKIILKLARNVGYDSDLRIKLSNGKYLEKSNIVDLLTHAMSVGKVLYGENDFIELLAKSDVDPDLVINDNVRLKLLQFLNKKSNNTVNTEEPNKINSLKRKRSFDNDDDSEVFQSKKKKYAEKSKNKRSFDHDEEENNEMELEAPNLIKKRRYIEEDSIDDDQINPDLWDIPKDV